MKVKELKKSIVMLFAAGILCAATACGSAKGNASPDTAQVEESTEADTASEEAALPESEAESDKVQEEDSLAETAVQEEASLQETDTARTVTDVSMKERVLEKLNTAQAPENPFPAFTGKDFDGNDVDSSLFSQNAVTVVNFWFTTCPPCIGELPVLNALNEALVEAGAGEVIGINVYTLDGSSREISKAANAMAKQEASYRNIYFDSSSEAGQFADNIMAFPTTYLVDRNGGIIGEEIVGSINDDAAIDDLLDRIDAIIEQDPFAE